MGRKKTAKVPEAEGSSPAPETGGAPAESPDSPRIEVGQSFDRPDPLKVKNPEAGAHYRFIRDDPANVHQKSLNWEPVKAGDADAKGMRTDVNGNVRHGDLILTRMPEEKYQERLRMMRPRQQEEAEKRREGELAELKKRGVVTERLTVR